MRNRSNESRREPVAIRITEEPSLYGLLIRERFGLVEYVSYHEARLRVASGQVPVARPLAR